MKTQGRDGSIQAWQGALGWDVVEAWPNSAGRYGNRGTYVAIDRGMSKAEAEQFATRLRKSFELD